MAPVVKTFHIGGSFFIALQEYGKRGLADQRPLAGNSVDPLLYTFIDHTSMMMWDRYYTRKMWKLD